MPPKKKEQQKMSLGDFMADSGFGGGSWADEVEETYVGGTQPLPAPERGSRAGGGTSSWQDRGYHVREAAPAVIPTKPPYTAHLGNLSYDATQESVTEFFEGCETVSVRIIEDRELNRPKGFGYVEFATVDGLKKALTLDGESFQGRMIKIKVADPPRGGDPGRGDSIREMGDWSRKGPLEGPPARLGGGRQGGDFGERRGSRDPAAESRPARDITWERRGPLAPLSPEEGGPRSRDGSRPRRAGPDGMGERSDSFRGARNSPAATWGERSEGSRPRQEPAEIRPERVPTAAEKDNQWRDRMRPDITPETSTPSSPAAPVAPAIAQRPKLNLAKRTVSEAQPTTPTSTDSKASPFGAARPIDTATREKQVEERRQQAIKEKQEAEKANEERRAKEAAAAAEAKVAEEAAAAAAAKKAEEEKANNKAEETKETKETKEPSVDGPEEKKAPAPTPAQPKEAPKPKPFEGNWRSGGGERGPRGPPRGPRGDGPHRGSRDIRNEHRDSRGPRHDGRGPRNNGPSNQPANNNNNTEPAPATKIDEDGWTTVAVGKKGRGGRPVAS